MVALVPGAFGPVAAHRGAAALDAGGARVSERYGWTVVDCLPELTGKPWDGLAQAFLRAVRPSEVRVIRVDALGHYVVKTDAKVWRVTVYVDAAERVTRIAQEVEVDLPDGVQHGFDLGERLRKGR